MTTDGTTPNPDWPTVPLQPSRPPCARCTDHSHPKYLTVAGPVCGPNCRDVLELRGEVDALLRCLVLWDAAAEVAAEYIETSHGHRSYCEAVEKAEACLPEAIRARLAEMKEKS